MKRTGIAALSAVAVVALSGSALGDAGRAIVDHAGNEVVGAYELAPCEDGSPMAGHLVGPADRTGEMMEMVFGPALKGGPAIGTRSSGVQFVFTGDMPEADGHSQVQYLPDGSAYVLASRESENLTIFDAATRTLIAAVALSGPPQSMDITSDGATVVTANLDGSASIVDVASATETVNIPGLGAALAAVRISPNDSTAFVIDAPTSTMTEIDLATGTTGITFTGGTLAQRFSFNLEPPAFGLEYTSFEYLDDSTIIFPSFGSAEVLFIDTATGASTPVPTLDRPFEIQISADGTKAVVGHNNVTAVTVIDTATRATTVVPVPAAASGPVAINPDATRAAVPISGNAGVVDLVSGAWLGTQSTALANDVLTTSDGQHVLCVGFRGSLLSFATGSLVQNTNFQVSAAFGATSPTADEAVMFSTTFGEDIVAVTTNGSSAGLVEFDSSGPGIEGDRARTAAVSPDGSIAVAAHNLSDNAAVVDVATGNVLGWFDVGQRVGEVGITPDGTKAVVVPKDGFDVTIIDLVNLTSSTVPTGFRCDEVVMSPDSNFAYLNQVSSGDGVWKIDLNAGTGQKLLIGNMGGVGYAFGRTSGIALSPDGSLLVACASFDDQVYFIDTATFTTINTRTGFGFPSRASVSPDGSLVAVSDRNAGLVSTYSFDGTAWQLANVYAGLDSPYNSAFLPGGGSLYVLNTGTNNRTLAEIDVASGTIVDSVSFSETPVDFVVSSDGARIAVATGTASTSVGGSAGFSQTVTGEIVVLDTTAGNAVVETIVTDQAPSDIVATEDLSVIVTPAPNGDGLVIVGGEVPCPGDTNGDLLVNADDLLTVLGNFGQSVGGGAGDGDLDGSGVVNADDLLEVLGNFGVSC